MDALFRRLQEVTELPTISGGDGSSDGGNAASNLPGLPPLEELDSEELAEQLRESRRDAAEYQRKWEALKSESSRLNEEYSAYKTKVQSWREQMRVARAQDRKTIELLRNSSVAVPASSPTIVASDHGDENDAASGAGSVAAGAGSSSGGSTEAIYVASLEEQVRHLKDAIRQGHDERGALRLELKRAQDQHQEELKRLSELPLPPGNSEKGSADSNKEAMVAGVPATHTTMILQMRIDAKEAEVQQLQRTVHELERQNEVLSDEARSCADSVHRLEAAHLAQLSQAQGLLDEHRQVQYIRSLESEIRMWKAEAQAARAGLTPMFPSHNDDISNDASTSAAVGAAPSKPSGELLEEMSGLRAALLEKDELLKEMRSQMADVSVEASLQEESIERMFNDCREMEERLMSKQEEVQAACRDRDAWQYRCESAELSSREIKRDAEDLADKLCVAQSQLSKLSKDHTQVGEVLRGLRLQLAQQQPSGKNESGVGSGNEPSSNAAASTLHNDAGSTASYAATLVSELTSVLSSRAHQLRNVSAAQEQVHRFWTDMMTKRKALWTNTRWRINLMVVLFVFLVILFSFYQALGAFEESNIEDALRKCEVELKALRKT